MKAPGVACRFNGGSAHPAPTPDLYAAVRQSPQRPLPDRVPIVRPCSQPDHKSGRRAFRRCKKEDPGARRARVFRRMGEGLGAGGHTTRRRLSTPRWRIRSTVPKLFSGAGPTRQTPTPRRRPYRLFDRQIDPAAVRKLQPAQHDTYTPRTAATPLDHEARTNREPAGKPVDAGTSKTRTHQNLRDCHAPPGRTTQCQPKWSVP